MAPFTVEELEDIQDLFIQDGKKIVIKLEEQIGILENDPSKLDSLLEIYRIFHTLKGNSGTAGLDGMETFFHSYESLIKQIQETPGMLDSEMIDFFYESLEIIDQCFLYLKEHRPYENKIDDFSKKLENRLKFKGLSLEEKEKHEKYTDIFEKFGLKEFGIQSNNNIAIKNYSIEITLDEKIKLKLARILVVLKNIQNYGNIARSDPVLTQIIRGNLSNSFKLFFQTQESEEFISKKILQSGEIESVDLKLIDIEEMKEDYQKLIPTKNLTNSVIDMNSNFDAIDDVSIKLTKLDEMLNFFGELVVKAKQLDKRLQDTSDIHSRNLIYDIENNLSIIRELLLDLQLVPLASSFRIYPRMIRNLAKREDKEISFSMRHNNIKVEQKIVNELIVILNHLLRNSIDHGIETIHDRMKDNKKIPAEINLDINIQNNALILQISDDGVGINPNLIRKSALKKGIISTEQLERMTEKEIINLIYLPSFSTSENVTTVSGRGMGLNIVKEKLNKLGGIIEIDSEVGRGTKFIIQIPLSRSLVSALLIKIEEEIFSIPLDDVEKVFEINPSEIVEENGKYFVFVQSVNRNLPFVNIKKAFGIQKSKNYRPKIKVVHIKKGLFEILIPIDEFLEETEILIKNLNVDDEKIKGTAGVAILDDGRVSFVIDPLTLL